MNAKTLIGSMGMVALITAGSALAADVGTRSVEEAYADLMRTYKSAGGQPGQLTSRSSKDAYADLIRDWDGKQTQRQGEIVGTTSSAAPVASRSVEDANRDLMREW